MPVLPYLSLQLGQPQFDVLNVAVELLLVAGLTQLRALNNQLSIDYRFFSPATVIPEVLST